IILVLLFGLMLLRERQKVRARARALTWKVTKQAPEGASGLILLVSPYNSHHDDLKDRRLLTERIEAILAKNPDDLCLADFEAVHLDDSNLRTQIDAVAFHAGKHTL